jgi:predicted lipoprotein
MARPDLNRSQRLFGLPRWLIAVVPIVAVLVGAAFSVTPVSKAQTASQSTEFVAKTWAAKEYPKTVEPYVTSKAVDLATLLTALSADAKATETRYGHNAGSGSGYAFPVKLTGTAGDDSNGLVPLKVDGVPGKWLVSLQVGPAINGSALRDVSGKIAFGSFQNQIDYQNAALALNDQVKTKVLSKVDPSSLKGRTVEVVGAFAEGANPDFVGIVPTSVTVR